MYTFKRLIQFLLWVVLAVDLVGVVVGLLVIMERVGRSRMWGFAGFAADYYIGVVLVMLLFVPLSEWGTLDREWAEG